MRSPITNLPCAGVGRETPAFADRSTGRQRSLRDEHLPRADTGAGLEEDVALGDELVVQRRDRLPHVDRGAHGPQRVVLVQGGDAEHRDDVVVRDLRKRAPVPLDACTNRSEIPVEHRTEQLGVQVLEQAVGVDDARGEHRDDLPGGACRRRGHRDRRRGALDPRRRPERLVLAEDRLLQLAQLVRRLDPELVDEHPTDVLVRLERIHLATAAVEREHQLRSGSLAVRLSGDEPLQVGDDVDVAAERELRVDELLARRQLELLEPRDLRPRERLEREVGERWPAKEGERAPQQLGSLCRELASRDDDLTLEADGVDLLSLEIERVPGRKRRDRLATELLP